MADDGSAQSQIVWPISKFYFQVKWGAEIMLFQEISGLDGEAQVIEFSAGDSKTFSTEKMPGMQKFGNITLKKGVFMSDTRFGDWFSQIKMDTIKRLPVTISLLDETGTPTMVWTLANAWPSKITGTELESDNDEIAIESMEISHQGLSITSG